TQPQPVRFPFTLQQLVYGLFVLTGLCAAIPIAILIRTKGNFQAALGPVFLWGCGLTLASLAAALSATGLVNWQKPREEGGLTEDEKVRFLLLALGGVIGLMTAINGAVMPFTIFRDELKGGLEKWRASPAGLVWSGLALFGGLGLMFASLQLGRG